MAEFPTLATGANGESCFMRLNKDCNRLLLLLIHEMKSLDDKGHKSNWDGIDTDHPENSRISLFEMLRRFDDVKQYSQGGDVLEVYEDLETAQTDFYQTLSSQEAHILLGSLRARNTNTFLFNPCYGSSGKEEYKLNDFYALATDSFLFGAVIKAAYLMLCLGIKTTTADSIQAMVIDDVTYPPLHLFVNHFQSKHLVPVRI